MDEAVFKIPSNDRFQIDDGELAWIAAERSTILAAGMDSPSWHLICQVTFPKKAGSIFVQFPYFSDSKGILSDAVFEPGDKQGTGQIRLRERGRATSHHVKYHHPPDGRVHFSQDGRIRTEVRRQSFPLTESGLLWELHAFLLEGFEVMSASRVRKDRAYIPSIFRPSLPRAITLSGEWQTRSEVLSRLEGPTRGPFCTVRRGHDGALLKVFLLGPPRGSPLDGHLLLLNMGKINDAPADRPTMIFLGGWDSPDRASVAPGSGCLSFMYPSGDHEELVKQVGTVDFVAE